MGRLAVLAAALALAWPGAADAQQDAQQEGQQDAQQEGQQGQTEDEQIRAFGDALFPVPPRQTTPGLVTPGAPRARQGQTTGQAGQDANDQQAGEGTQPSAEQQALMERIRQSEEFRNAQREASFEQAMRQFLPLSPEQIMELRRRLDAQQNAGAKPVRRMRPRSTSIDLTLEPGVAPPTVHLGVDSVTALNFIDVTGEPWPVAATVVGNPNSFDVKSPVEGGNLVTISPLGPYARGNLTISLQGLGTPVVLELESGGDVVDYRVDMRVAARGPNAAAQYQVVSDAPVVGDETMSTFLNGVPPEGATPLDVQGGPAKAWRYRGTLYVRTSMTVISPAWESRARGAAGMRVYRMPETPVLLASNNGRLVNMTIREEE